jgi:ABC-type dipeptide/oligopeptide/nickel transport system ATPase subunit
MRLDNLPGGQIRARCEDLARQVGLPVDLLDRFPHQLSGGQKAHVGIARAIALKPDLIILDEPTAALFPLFVLAMGIVAALGNTVTNILFQTPIYH